MIIFDKKKFTINYTYISTISIIYYIFWQFMQYTVKISIIKVYYI